MHNESIKTDYDVEIKTEDLRFQRELDDANEFVKKSTHEELKKRYIRNVMTTYKRKIDVLFDMDIGNSNETSSYDVYFYTNPENNFVKNALYLHSKEYGGDGDKGNIVCVFNQMDDNCKCIISIASKSLQATQTKYWVDPNSLYRIIKINRHVDRKSKSRGGLRHLSKHKTMRNKDPNRLVKQRGSRKK